MVVKKDSSSVVPSHRQRQAQATREQVAKAARKLFAERGWVGTTIRAIAEAADIPAQTIYSAFGTKARILQQIREMWLLDSNVQQEHVEAMLQPDPVRRLRMSAHWFRTQMEMGHDVIAIYQQAALSDPEMDLEWQAVLAGRERAIGKVIDSVEKHWARGLTRQGAIDRYVVCTAAETYRALVLDRGWSLDDFEQWTADLLVAQLLEPTPD